MMDPTQQKKKQQQQEQEHAGQQRKTAGGTATANNSANTCESNSAEAKERVPSRVYTLRFLALTKEAAELYGLEVAVDTGASNAPSAPDVNASVAATDGAKKSASLVPSQRFEGVEQAVWLSDQRVKGEALHIFHGGGEAGGGGGESFDFYHPTARVACEGIVAFSMCNEKRRGSRVSPSAASGGGSSTAAAVTTEEKHVMMHAAMSTQPSASKEKSHNKGHKKKGGGGREGGGRAAATAGGGKEDDDASANANRTTAAGGAVVPLKREEEGAVDDAAAGGSRKRQDDDAAAEEDAEAGAATTATGGKKGGSSVTGTSSSSGSTKKGGSETSQHPLACAVYIAGKGGSPSSVRILDLMRGGEVLCSKSFYQGGDVTFKWSHDGRAMVALVHCDATDKSYYGSDSLYFFKADGSYSCQLVSADDGPIQDVEWSPSTLEFVLCRGPTPPEVLLYDGSKSPSGPKLSFGRLMCNTLRWDPFSRVVLTGGFGNMAGDVSLWHKAQRKLLAITTARFSVTCDFTPDGLNFLTATTSPRLRVDNCICIYSLTGNRLLRQEFDCLYSVQICPVTPTMTMELQQEQSKALQRLLASMDAPTGSKPTAVAASASGSAASTAPATPKRYRPPGASAAWESHARQTVLNQSSSLSLLGARSSNRSIPGLPPGAAKFPPGYAPPATQSSGKGKKK